MDSAPTIPTIDFSRFLGDDEESKQAVAGAILDSFKRTGFVCLKNHGLPQHKVDEMFEWSRAFFALSLEDKNLAPHPPSGTHHRGYSAPGVELVTQHVYDAQELEALRSKNQDIKESFECGKEDNKLMPNIWLPDGVLPGFREACMNFYWTCHELEMSILRALAVGLGLSETYFFPFHKEVDNQLRLLHYPSVTAPANEHLSRIAAHTDYDTMTLLFQDDVGGLEVEDPHFPGTFIQITPISNTVVVNAGDFLARWSNDIIKSTSHRVRSPPNSSSVDGLITVPERYSIPYFCSCDFNIVVDTIPGTWGVDNPKKYEPISAVDYIMKRLATAY